jgi:hypothetical protein
MESPLIRLEKKVPIKKDGWGMAIPHPSFFIGDSSNI